MTTFAYCLHCGHRWKVTSIHLPPPSPLPPPPPPSLSPSSSFFPLFLQTKNNCKFLQHFPLPPYLSFPPSPPLFLLSFSFADTAVFQTLHALTISLCNVHNTIYNQTIHYQFLLLFACFPEIIIDYSDVVLLDREKVKKKLLTGCV